MSACMLLLACLSVFVSGTVAGGTLSLSINGLPDLGSGFQYEHWLIVAGEAQSLGVFNATNDVAYEASLWVTDAQLSAMKYVLTIEPNPDPDTAPADTHVLAGDFNQYQNVAVLDVANPAALGNDFSNANGEFILAAPTGGSEQPHVNGIWYLVPGEGAGLYLPTLPAGWVYEGWVVGANGPWSTGTFTNPVGADSDGAGATAGNYTDAAPPYPGQDYVQPEPVNLTNGYTAVISIEPYPDNDAAPFAYKPLVKAIEDVAPLETQMMWRDLNSFATGVAVLQDGAATTLVISVFASAFALASFLLNF